MNAVMKCKKMCMGIVWFFVLLLLAWWLGLVAGLIYCIMAPFAACCDCAKKGTNFLLKGIQLPYTISMFMVDGKTCKQALISCVC